MDAAQKINFNSMADRIEQLKLALSLAREVIDDVQIAVATARTHLLEIELHTLSNTDVLSFNKAFACLERAGKELAAEQLLRTSHPDYRG